MTLSIRERLGDLLPAVPYGLESLLRLLDVEVTREVPSAAVPVNGDPRLLINPDFVAAYCQTDEALFTLILHELHHVLLGHTRLYERISPAHNIAFDAVINAMLCRRNPGPRWTQLFRATYRADRFPELLLRPPPGFPDDIAFARSLDPRWRAALIDLYVTGTGTFADVYALLVQELGQVELPLLLGQHGPDEAGVSKRSDPELFASVRAIVERWPQPADPRIGRSLQEALAETTVVVRRPSSAHQVLRRALRAAARSGQRATSHRAPIMVRGQAAWPSRDRRAFAMSAAGQQPLLYERALPGPIRPVGLTPVDVYVDVSGSCRAYVPALYEAVLSCRSFVAPQVHLFSTRVDTVTLDDLRRGRVRSTGGTTGAALTEHLHRRGTRAAVVLTDGYVGPIPAEHLASCRRARLQVVLTPDGWPSDLAPGAAAVHYLESS